MSAAAIDDSILKDLGVFGAGSRMTIVLGAGASMASGLPSWDEFALEAVKRSQLVGTGALAESLLEIQDKTIVLEGAKRRAKENWDTVLFDALYGNADEPKPSPIHMAATEHYFGSDGGAVLATLNFDALLEDALLDQSSRVFMGDTWPTVTADDVPVVYHLHGFVAEIEGKRYVESPVVTFRDYADLVGRDRPWQKRFLQDSMSSGPLLLVGTSYQDPDIRQWLHAESVESGLRYPALVLLTREGTGLTEQEYRALGSAFSDEWESIGLKAVCLQDFYDVAILIGELRFLGENHYQTPKERLTTIWSIHQENREILQNRYERLLCEQTRRLSKALNRAGVHQAALWLATGNGTIGRWALAGEYLLPTHRMKEVPVAHDSPRVAGEALAKMQTLAQKVERHTEVQPRWSSVVAVPVSISQPGASDLAVAVVTFGVDRTGEYLTQYRRRWQRTAAEIGNEWSATIEDSLAESTMTNG